MVNTWQPQTNTEALYELREKYRTLTAARPRSSVVKRRFDEFASSFIYNSNAIEGNPITHDDTAFILTVNS
jgi:hypothetical protein